MTRDEKTLHQPGPFWWSWFWREESSPSINQICLVVWLMASRNLEREKTTKTEIHSCEVPRTLSLSLGGNTSESINQSINRQKFLVHLYRLLVLARFCCVLALRLPGRCAQYCSLNAIGYLLLFILQQSNEMIYWQQVLQFYDWLNRL